MADSSGVAIYSINRDQLITASLRLLRVVDPEGGQTPTTTMLNNGNEALNILIKNWQAMGLILTTYQQISIPLLNGQQTYTIGPATADVTSTRPLRLFDGSFIRQTVAGVVTDTSLQIFSRQRYFQTTTKAVTGTPYGIYYWPGITFGASTNPGLGKGTLYVYFPQNGSGTTTLFVNVQRPVYDMTASTDSFDLPQEWFRALKFGLAADVGPEYGAPADIQTYLDQKTMLLKNELEQWNLDEANVAFGEDRTRQERARDQTTTKG